MSGEHHNYSFGWMNFAVDIFTTFLTGSNFDIKYASNEHAKYPNPGGNPNVNISETSAHFSWGL
ncbi:MAG TPA: hypothetical protein ENJ82_04525 [Bacteroidetes bacterium]|nr:hypothetical protein [Bacteroidota bacterium]